MTGKQKRDRLFKGGRPNIRKFDPEQDMWVLWAAYDLDSFPNLPKGWKKDEFRDYVLSFSRIHSACLVIEDKSKYFRSGVGPCAFVVVDNFGWRIEPHADFFKWATHRMRLRCHVAFYQMVRYSGDVGVCMVRSLEKDTPFFMKLRTYGVLYPCGKVPGGDPRGDEYLFYIGGSRAGIDGTRRKPGVYRGDIGGWREGPGTERPSPVPGPDLLREQGRLDRDQRAEESDRTDQGQVFRPREPDANRAIA